MSDLDLDLTNQKNINIDKDYINHKLKEITDTGVYDITQIICSMTDDTNMVIEKTVLVLVLSKVMGIVLAIENASHNHENPIDTLLKRYKTSSTQKYLSSTKLENGDEPIYFTKYVENNKIIIDIDYTYYMWYGLDKCHDYQHTIKIDYAIVELFEIIMSENIEHLKNIISNTINARIKWRNQKSKPKWKDDNHGFDLSDPETHFELFGEYPDD